MQNFNYHSHTYRCGHADLDMKDEDYIKEYIKLGIKKMAFTDHSPLILDKRPNIRMDYSEKDEYLNSINKLKQKYNNKIEIETGFEVEYLPGEEKNLLILKSETDKIILGQHFIYDDDKNLKTFRNNNFSDSELIKYAQYIDKALELGIPDIIAHPDLFLKNSKTFNQMESEISHMICKSAEKYDIPLEINLSDVFEKIFYIDRKFNDLSISEARKEINNVRYPNANFWKVASNYNVKVLYGIDAHHKGQIMLFDKLIQLSNEIIGNDIIKKLQFINEL